MSSPKHVDPAIQKATTWGSKKSDGSSSHFNGISFGKGKKINTSYLDPNPGSKDRSKSQNGKAENSDLLKSVAENGVVAQFLSGMMKPRAQKQNNPRKKFQTNELSYSKIRRCLNSALFATRMNGINERLRSYGTSSLLYNLIFKNRTYVRGRLNTKFSLMAKQEEILPSFMVHPNWPPFIIWTLFTLLFIAYAVVIMPYTMIFIDNYYIDIFEDSMNYFFIADCVLNFFVAYYDANSLYIKLTSDLSSTGAK